jgi:hypothetical protein
MIRSKLIFIGLFILSFFAVKAQKNAPQKGIDFRIVIMPDIQYYVSQTHGGKVEMFRDQIKWIKKNYADSSIVYVAGMGDNVDDTGHGETVDQQWVNVKDNGGYYSLETPLPGLPYGIPYGLTLGNHDEADTLYKPGSPKFHGRSGLDPVRNTTYRYNKFFGVDHFQRRPYYGGHANLLNKNNNDCHFDHFTVGNQQYIVVYIAYDSENYEDKDNLMIKWADSVIKANPKAKAIVVSHGMLKWGPIEPSGYNPWNPQGERIYLGLRDNPNVMMFLCGHVKEGYREEVYKGRHFPFYMSDYQGNENGGNGVMRTMKINTVTGIIGIRTFSPYLKQ